MPLGYLHGWLLRTPSSLGDRPLNVPINCSVPAFLVGARTRGVAAGSRVGVADLRATARRAALDAAAASRAMGSEEDGRPGMVGLDFGKMPLAVGGRGR